MEINSSSSLHDHQIEIEAINQVREMTAQLRAIVHPLLPPADCRSQVVGELFGEILNCSTRAISRLQSGYVHAQSIEINKGKEKMLGEKNTMEQETKPVGHKRRRYHESESGVTTVPHYDGHQWRKYGQKQIYGAKYPRSYYRCTYNKEQGCPATKTIQQVDRDTDPAEYAVIYIGKHTCKTNKLNTPYVIESNPQTPSSITTTVNTNETNILFNQWSPSSVLSASPNDGQDDAPGFGIISVDSTPFDPDLWGQIGDLIWFGSEK